MTDAKDGSTRALANSDPTGADRAASGRIVLWTIVVIGAVAVFTVSSSLPASAFGVPVVIALLLAGVQAAAMVLSLVNPPIAAVLSILGVLGFALVTPPGGPWPVMVTSMIAHASVVLLVTRRQWATGLAAVLTAALGAAVVAFVSPIPQAAQGGATADLIVFASVTAVSWLVGLLLGRWSAVRAQLVRERAVSAEQLARREAAEERTRLARELHDVVAHGMSAIQVQASSARYRLERLSPEAIDEFEEIATLARTSMSEMRALLAVLRNEGTEVEGAPQPTAADIPQLVESARRSGSRVELDDELSDAEVAGLDPVLSLTVYRIVQESLSNVARHATGADTLVRLERSGEQILVEVGNAPPVRRPAYGVAPDEGGHGIRGMRERVDLHHGTLEAVPTREGGFVVRVALPMA
jgi:signal transduction histidine kinase